MNTIRRVLFIGSKPLGLRVLEHLHALAPDLLVAAVTVDDSSDARTTYQRLTEFCRKHRIPCHTARNRRHSEELIRELAPDLCFVAGWYWLIGSETLRLAQAGFVGLHFSLLPQLRGSSPLVWAMLTGTAETGLSLFSLTEGMDEGPIWAQRRLPIGEHEFIGEVLSRFENEAVATIREVYPLILAGSIQPTPQKSDNISYCAQRTPDDGLLDWRADSLTLYRAIRAQSDPYPGAFTTIDGKRMTVWRARPFEQTYYGCPGQVGRILDDGVCVVCGNNRALVLEEVEVGGSRDRAERLIRSIRTRLGHTSSPTEHRP